MKKKLLTSLAALLLTSSLTASASPIPLRGIVEGFYGTPWSQSDRLNMIDFCQQEKLNAYIYAPKDDPYHRSKWREPYPQDKLTELSDLIAAAKRQQVKFIFAVSPGLDISFAGEQGQNDRLAMQEKLNAMYDLGVRDFAIFFDDIENKDGQGQAEFLNWLEENFVKSHPGVSPLITVPTEYFHLDMTEKGAVKEYTKSFSDTLDKDILVLYTGEKVVPDGLQDKDYAEANKLYGRRLGLWWNYPVSDYLEAKLALGPIEKLPRKKLPAIFFNPMKYAQLSKLSLTTGAAYAKYPRGYKPAKAWRKALKKEYGPLAADMERFADHSQHMKVSWAEIGPADGKKLRQLADSYWAAKTPRKRLAAEKKLTKELLALDKSIGNLLISLPLETLAECRPQLEQLQRIARADLLGLDLLAGSQDKAADFAQALQEVKAHDQEALVSEQSARALLTEIEQKLP